MARALSGGKRTKLGSHYLRAWHMVLSMYTPTHVTLLLPPHQFHSSTCLLSFTVVS